MVEVYFAYGSNLDQEQMTARCPCFKRVGIAKKLGFRLTFRRYSENRESGVASIEESKGDVVWGALYELTPGDVRQLDSREGVNSGAYRKQPGFEVIGPDGSTVQSYTYIANEQGCFKPAKDYLALIIKGAKELNLPDKYINELERIPTLGEPNN